MKILVTGAAGFIGHFTVLRLLREGYDVIGIDQINDYYDPQLKLDRLKVQGVETLNENGMVKLDKFSSLVNSSGASYSFFKIDLENDNAISELFCVHNFDSVIHLAAQAGMLYSLENPRAYIKSNIAGFVNILEGCRASKTSHLIYASSSSVYGTNKRMPFKADHTVDHPVSLYAATKRTNELMAHSYSASFGIPTTGLRFFTVYGPWGRPDMAYFSFTKDILSGKPIKVYNNGEMSRDFTYIDDIVESLIRLIPLAPKSNDNWNYDNPTPANSYAPFRVCNIGCNSPVSLLEFIEEIELALGKKAEKVFLPMQHGDVPATWADVSSLIALTGYKPEVQLREGVRSFVHWYRKYYGA